MGNGNGVALFQEKYLSEMGSVAAVRDDRGCTEPDARSGSAVRFVAGNPAWPCEVSVGKLGNPER